MRFTAFIAALAIGLSAFAADNSDKNKQTRNALQEHLVFLALDSLESPMTCTMLKMGELMTTHKAELNVMPLPDYENGLYLRFIEKSEAGKKAAVIDETLVIYTGYKGKKMGDTRRTNMGLVDYFRHVYTMGERKNILEVTAKSKAPFAGIKRLTVRKISDKGIFISELNCFPALKTH